MRQIHALYAPSEKDAKYNGKTEKHPVKAVKQPSQGEKGLPPGSEENRRTKMSKAWEDFKAQQKKLEQERQELRPSKAWEDFKAQQKKLEQERQVSDPIEEDIRSSAQTKTIPVRSEGRVVEDADPYNDTESESASRVTAADVVARTSVKQQPTKRAATVSADRQQSARTAYAKRLIENNKAESKSLFKQADDLYHQGDEEGSQQLRQQGESLERTNEKLKAANPDADTSRLGNIVKAAGANATAAAGELFGQLLAPTETNAIGAQARAAANGDDNQIQAQFEKDKALQERIQNRAANIGEDSAEFTEQAKEGLGTIGRAGVDLGINALNLAADAGVAAATGGSSLIPMAVRAYGSGAQQARLGGGSELEQFGYGAMTTGVEAATELLSSIAAPLKQVYGAGAVDDVVQNLISKVGSKYGQKGLQVLSSAAGEGVEEAIAGALDPLLQRLTYNEDAELDVKDVAYDAALGAVMGGLLGLPGNVNTDSDGRVVESAMPDNAAETGNINNKDGATQKPENVNTTDVIEADIKGVGAAELGFDPYSRAMNEYGVIRERSDPNREVPKQIAGGEVSQAADTIVGSEYLSDTDLEAVRAMIAAGNANKKTVTWNDAYAQADAELESKGLNQAYLEWRQRQMDGTSTDYDTALSIRLLQTANKEGNSEISQGIFAAGWQEASNAGRKLQAQQMWKAAGPEGQLKIVNDQLVKLYNSLNSRQKKRLGDNKLQINPTLAEEYRNATDDAQRDAVLEKIYKDTAQRIPNTFADRWNAWRYLSMLGNVRTHVRNTTGNTLQGAVRTVSDTASTAIQSVLPQSQREQSFVGLGKEASELRAVAKADAKEMKSVLSGNGKYSDLNVKNEVDKHRNYFGTSWLGRIINWAAKGNSKLLDVEDALFSTPAYRQYLARYLKAKGITAQQWQEMTDSQKAEAREYAAHRAQQAVFRDNNDFSDAISQLGSDKSTMTEKAIGHLAEAVIPYKRTPANILVTVEQYSPLGLINTAANTVKAAKGDVAAAKAIDSACRSATGTVLLAAGYILAKNGLLTGRVDDELELMQGHQSYAFELFGHSYTLPNLGPSVAPLLVGAELAEMDEEEEGSMAGKVLNALLTVTEPVFETTMLSGLNDALSTDPYADENALIQFITRAVTNYLGQGVSSMGSAIANTLDDTRRTTYSTETGAAKIVDTAVQSNMNRMLGLREQGKVYVDRWGRTEDTGTMGQRAVENFLSPGYYSKIQSSPMEDELRRVMDATGEDVLPKYAPKSITYKDEKRELTAEDNTRFQTTMGQMTHDLYTEITEMDGYGELSDEDKVKLLREARSLAENTAKQEFWGEGFENKELDKLTQSGLDTATALLAKAATSEDNMPADKTADGETISNSRKLKVMHYVDGLELDDSEKAAMLKYLGQDVGEVCAQAVEKGISYSDWTKWQSDLNGKLGHSGQTEVRRQYISNRDWTDEQKVFAAEKAGLITKSMEGLMNMGASYDQAVDAKDEDDIAQTLMELGHDVGTACIIAAGLTDAGGKDGQRAAIYDLVEENGYSRDVLEDSIFAINRQDSSMPTKGGDSAFTVLDDDVRSSLTRLQGSSDFRITTLLPEVGGTTSIDGTTYTYDEEDIALWKDGYRAVYDLVDATAFKDAAVAERIDEWATQTAKFFALWDDQGKERDDIPAVYDKLHTAMDRGFTAEEYTKAYILKGQAGNKTDTFAAWRKAGYSESQINTLWSILG